jgi:hypothetical protein
MSGLDDIRTYEATLSSDDRALCERLRAVIAFEVPGALARDPNRRVR